MSRDPIGMGGGINLCGFVGNQPLSRHDKRGLSWWNCCDECSPLGKKRLRGINSFLRAGTKSDISPNVEDAGIDILHRLQIAGLIGIGGEVVSAEKLAGLILALTSGAIDYGRTMKFEDAALVGIDDIRRKLLLKEGAVVWIRLDWDECKNSTCILLFRKYKNWISDHKWKKCARGGTHPLGGFDLSVSGELGKGIQDCIHDAVKEFSDDSF